MRFCLLVQLTSYPNFLAQTVDSMLKLDFRMIHSLILKLMSENKIVFILQTKRKLVMTKAARYHYTTADFFLWLYKLYKNKK